MTHAIENVSWKSYALSQPGGGVPVGPAAILVHIASTNIPFTSESKDAVADVPEIVAEVELGLKEVGRKLRRYISKKSALSERKEKEEIIRKILPRISKKLAELLAREEPDINPVIAKIMGNLLVRRSISSENGLALVTLVVANYGEAAKAFKLHETVSVEAESVEPPARVIALGDGYDHLWKLTLRPGERQLIRYTVPSEGVRFSEPVVEGVASELVSGARVVG